MLKVGSRKTWSPVERGASKRKEARTLYLSVAAAAAPARYSAAERLRLARGGAGEADLRHGDEVERRRRRRIRAAPTKSRGGAAGGEREGAGAGEISSRWGLHAFAKMMPRAAADASDMALRIEQNTRRTNFFAAPARIGRLLEDQICLPALYTGSYYSAGSG
jgi:hypothetical protein